MPDTKGKSLDELKKTTKMKPQTRAKLDQMPEHRQRGYMTNPFMQHLIDSVIASCQRNAAHQPTPTTSKPSAVTAITTRPNWNGRTGKRPAYRFSRRCW